MLRIVGKGYSFDDVLLVPKRSSFSSRFDGKISLSSVLVPGVTLDVPFIAANMDSVSGFRMTNALNSLGGTAIVHRFMSIEDHRKELLKIETGPVISCIGVGDNGIRRLEATHLKETNPILIDVAHGHSDSVIKQVVRIKSLFPKAPIIAGNVATAAGANDLASAGASCIKVGVGPGSLCSTRVTTGCGVPQLTAISNIVEALKYNYPSVTVVGDGGVRTSGDIVKCLAAGAAAVMLGGLFSGTEETPGDILNMPDGKFKIYRGMASAEAQLSWKREVTSIEGESMRVRYKGPVSDVFKNLQNGVLSGMSYLNASNLSELRENAEFIEQTASGYRESVPHALLK